MAQAEGAAEVVKLVAGQPACTDAELEGSASSVLLLGLIKVLKEAQAAEDAIL